MKDYYKILGVNENATAAQIKTAYRNLAKKHHPDKGGDENKFKEITEAFETLGNETARQKYDVRRKTPETSEQSFSSDFGRADFIDGFGTSFRDRWFKDFEKSNRSVENLNIYIRKEVPLADLMKGVSFEIPYSRTIVSDVGIGSISNESITIKVNLRENWQPINILNNNGEQTYYIRFIAKGMGEEQVSMNVKYAGDALIDIVFKTDDTLWMEPDGTVYHVVPCNLVDLLLKEPIFVDTCVGEKFKVKSYDSSNLSRIKFTIYNKGIKMPNDVVSNYVFIVQPRDLNTKNITESELETLKTILKKCR